MDSKEEYDERWMKGMINGKIIHIVIKDDHLYIDGEQFREHPPLNGQ